MTKNIYPYIRGTNKKYGTEENGGFWGENGYNCIEAGYIETDDAGSEVVRVIPLTMSADVVDILTLGLAKGQVDSRVAMDCIGDGYLRLFCDKSLKWYSDTLALSSMMLEFGEPTASVVEAKE